MSRAAVKAKLGLAGAEHDAAVDALIAEQVPAFAAALGAEAGGAWTAVYDVAALEWVAGEYAAQRLRAEGLHEAIEAEGLVLRPAARDPFDPTGLKRQAMSRLPAARPEREVRGAAPLRLVAP